MQVRVQRVRKLVLHSCPKRKETEKRKGRELEGWKEGKKEKRNGRKAKRKDEELLEKKELPIVSVQITFR
jgi:hypothetical protein